MVSFPTKKKQRGNQVTIVIKENLNPEYFEILVGKESIYPEIVEQNDGLTKLNFDISTINRNDEFNVYYNFRDIEDIKLFEEHQGILNYKKR